VAFVGASEHFNLIGESRTGTYTTLVHFQTRHVNVQAQETFNPEKNKKKQKSTSLVEVHLLFDLLIEFYQLVSLYDTEIRGGYKRRVEYIRKEPGGLGPV